MHRIAVPALLCCLLSCSNEKPLVQQSSAATQPPSSKDGMVDSTLENGGPATGVCPGLPALDNSKMPTDAPDSALQIFLVSAKRFGDTEASLSRCLGSPLEMTIDTVSNLHTGEPDNILHITYPGIRYSIYRVLADGKEILFEVEVFENTRELALGINVGVEWARVLDLLGAPTREEQGAQGMLIADYVADEFMSETVTFWVENGVVSRILWSYYID